MLTEVEVVRHLERAYLPMFRAMFGPSPEEAKAAFDDNIETAKAWSQKKGLAAIDANAFFAFAQTNPRLDAELQWKAGEGVGEDDARRWWDKPDLERQFIILMDSICNAGYYDALKHQGYNHDEAICYVHAANPSYVEFSSMSGLPRNLDFPLPIELRERVERRQEEERAKDPSGAAWADYRRPFTSFNAYIRHEIAAGRL